MRITWHVDSATAERFAELAYRFNNREISEAEFAEELCRLPGYPPELDGLPPRPGDDLQLVPNRTATRVDVAPRSGGAAKRQNAAARLTAGQLAADLAAGRLAAMPNGRRIR